MSVRARSIGFGDRFSHIFQDLTELHREHNGGGAYGQGVCHRFCQKYRHDLICKEMRQYKDQRNEQNDLPQNGQEQRSFSIAQIVKVVSSGSDVKMEINS